MNACSTLGCHNPVSKPGHTVCLNCWKAARTSKPISQPNEASSTSPKALSATRLSEHFHIRLYKVNPTLAELGLLEKVENGWVATPRGFAVGAQEKVDPRKNNRYVVWPPEILENSIFLYAFQTMAGDSSAEPAASDTSQDSEFRERLKQGAKHRTNDGHWVRSKAEALIDNWLYVMGLVHAYERRLPIAEEAYCDFYLPQGRIYIEYWGYEDDPKYVARKQEKLQLYRTNGLNLIELSDEHIEQLDDRLPILLRKFEVKVD
jgi:hypothetical protein